MEEHSREPGQEETVLDDKLGAPADDEVDEELLALPAPPPPLWYGLFTAAILVLSVLMMVWFWPEMRYLLHAIEGPVELGDAASLDMAKLEDNSYVTLEGIPLMSRTAAFTLTGTVNWSPYTDNTRKAFPLTGQPKVIVFWAESQAHKVYRDPLTDPVRPFVPSYFEGHLQRISSVHSNYDKVWQYFKDKLSFDVAPDAYLLVDGETPSEKWWAALAYALLLGMMVVNLLILKRFVAAWRA